MSPIERWSSYVTWLRENVPLAWENLAPPATEAAIAEVEQVTGQTLPVSLKEIWRVNDGQKATMIATRHAPAVPCIPTLSFLSTAMVLEIWREWDGLRRSESEKSLAELQSMGRSPDGKTRALYTHPAWIPVWSDPTRADFIGIDLDPGEKGTRGQIINFGRDEEEHFVFADDLDGLLAILLDEVRSGAWRASKMPYGKQGEIDWFGDPKGHFFNALHRRWKATQPKSPAEIVKELLAEAKRLKAAKKPADALALVEKVRAEMPNLGAGGLQLHAEILEDLKRFRDADAVYAELVERAPKLTQHAVRRAGNLLYDMNDPTLAEEVLRKALLVAPENVDLRGMLALTIGPYQKRYDESVKIYAELIEHDERDIRAWTRLAYLRACLGDVEGALANARQALVLLGPDPVEIAKDDRDLAVESAFYVYALAEEQERPAALAMLRECLAIGMRTIDWDYVPVVDLARSRGIHPAPLAKIGQVLNGRLRVDAVVWED